MPKARAHPDQLGFDYAVPARPSAPGSLAGLERQINEMVATILATEMLEGRRREVIAAEMSVFLDEEVSRAMLDAYSSPARTEHKVPMSRALALVAVTGRLDLLDPVLRRIGGAVLDQNEVMTAQIGHLTRVIDHAQAELRTLKRHAPTIRTGGKRGKSRR
ncbi:hypothetical protein ACFQ1E_08125 [Sphingomonas canadensis]|uniref:Uncharacterized protein n=1 Tax=Sphingomonas canadensis TaxID=1219257 RepID=A0ABW3HAH3_9SPHN|nr:hypothetical protein [Sphingomonas canadensis]MCW3836003.1 hypothetical protein [Sphingomonas canadensis]